MVDLFWIGVITMLTLCYVFYKFMPHIEKADNSQVEPVEELIQPIPQGKEYQLAEGKDDVPEPRSESIPLQSGDIPTDIQPDILPDVQDVTASLDPYSSLGTYETQGTSISATEQQSLAFASPPPTFTPDSQDVIGRPSLFDQGYNVTQDTDILSFDTWPQEFTSSNIPGVEDVQQATPEVAPLQEHWNEQVSLAAEPIGFGIPLTPETWSQVETQGLSGLEATGIEDVQNVMSDEAILSQGYEMGAVPLEAVAEVAGEVESGAVNIPTEKLEEYRECFDLFDLNKDNKISSKELRKMMENLGQQPSQDELDTIMNKADLNRNGYIDFDEFCLVMEQFMRPQSFEQQLRDAFRVIDRDGSGKIDAGEFKKILNNIGDSVNDSEMAEIIREIDMDGDGEVDFEEFVKIAVSAKSKS